ncbi:MAG: S41 family peptidase [Bacteroidota bacterium]
MPILLKPWRIVIAWLLIGLSITCTAQNERFSRTQLEADFAIFEQLLLQAHGAPYRYTDSLALQQTIQVAKSEIRDKMKPEAWSLLLGKVLHEIRCGHTSLGFPPEYSQARMIEDNLFPFPLWFGEKIRIAVAGESLPQGTEILAVNGRSIQELAEQIRAVSFGDGFVENGIEADLNERFQMKLLYQLGPQKKFQIDYVLPDGDSLRDKFPAISPIAGMMRWQQEQEAGLAKFEKIDSLRTVIVKLKTFDTSDAGLSRNELVKLLTFLNKLGKSRYYKHLIIDLRENTGGNMGIAAWMYSYLVDSPATDGIQQNVRLRQLPYRDLILHQQSGTRNNDVDSVLQHTFQPDSSGRLSRMLGFADLPAPEEIFRGKVYLLISGKTFSAGAYFAALAASDGRAILLGEESGGAYEGCTAGMFATWALPETGLRLQLPLVRFNYLGLNALFPHGRGVMPDRVIRPNFDDIIHGHDPVRAAAIALIRSSQ